MNRGRIARHYRQRRGVDIAQNLCLRCFQFGHRRGPHCRNDPLVTCGRCYRVYIFTKDCSCSQPRQEEMTLRLVSGTHYPRPVIDVTIGIRTYEAFINMSIENTKISLDVFQHINECRALMNQPRFTLNTSFEFPVRRRNQQASLRLDVQEQQADSVILGMDFFMRTGFTFVADRVSINERSPVIRCPKTVDFLYNLPQGSDLQSWLQENNRPIYDPYLRGEQPQLLEEPRVVIENPADDPPEDRDEDILDLHADEADLNIN